MITRTIFTVAALLLPVLANADDINGFWKHPEEPGWFEINLDEGKGTVVRNDKFPERVGRVFIKDIQVDNAEENVWHGQIWAEKLGEYRKARISLPEPDRMEFKVKVGFMSRTIDWMRVDEVPAPLPE